MTLNEIMEEIKKANNIIILTHENPDGDAMGSSLAFYIMLKNLNKNVDLVIPEYPKMYNFLPKLDEIKKEGSNNQYDLAIALDSADIKRLNGFSKYFEDAKVRVVIDHHTINTMFGDLNYVNPASPACSEILATLFGYWNVEITKEIGICLLTGIITDTGGFKYQGVTSETFEFVAWLLNKGINVSEIYRKSFQLISKTRFELRKIAENRLEFLENDKITFTYITLEDEKNVNSTSGEYEGIVELGRDIEGVEVSIFLRETEKGYKCSLRSNEYVNVADVSIVFSGGGHIRAAGCNLTGTLEQAKEKIINQVKLHLK